MCSKAQLLTKLHRVVVTVYIYFFSFAAVACSICALSSEEYLFWFLLWSFCVFYRVTERMAALKSDCLHLSFSFSCSYVITRNEASVFKYHLTETGDNLKWFSDFRWAAVHCPTIDDNGNKKAATSKRNETHRNESRLFWYSDENGAKLKNNNAIYWWCLLVFMFVCLVPCVCPLIIVRMLKLPLCDCAIVWLAAQLSFMLTIDMANGWRAYSENQK